MILKKVILLLTYAAAEAETIAAGAVKSTAGFVGDTVVVEDTAEVGTAFVEAADKLR